MDLACKVLAGLTVFSSLLIWLYMFIRYADKLCGAEKPTINGTTESNTVQTYTRAREVKGEFLYLIDGMDLYGVGKIPPIATGVSSYEIGLCKLEYINNELHVYLRQPGYLIGRHGTLLNRIEKLLNTKIRVHEVDLYKDN